MPLDSVVSLVGQGFLGTPVSLVGQVPQEHLGTVVPPVSQAIVASRDILVSADFHPLVDIAAFPELLAIQVSAGGLEFPELLATQAL